MNQTRIMLDAGEVLTHRFEPAALLARGAERA